MPAVGSGLPRAAVRTVNLGVAAVMQFTQPTQSINVSALRLGMFIHLEGGWLSHPFPRSSFKITSDDQLVTLRSLGINMLRWCPELSDPESLPVDDSAATEVAPDAEEPAEAAAPDARVAHREALIAQRQALSACERQFNEALRASKLVFDSVDSEPAQARQGAQALTRQIVDKMLGAGDICIRLLSEAAGDKASAHAVNVSIISLLMGRIFGLAEAEMLDLGLGALMHDVGKADIPERFRHRDEHHTTAEQRLYETHVAHGIAQARRMELGVGVTNVIAHHHELIDGSGFPLKLTSDRTSVPSRIVALVNRYDNLCNPVNPGKAFTPHEAVALMFAQGKNKYDPAILGAFIKMMGVYPAGSVVQLTDDRYALVVGVNSSRPLKPRVMVHEPGVPRDDALILDLETAGGVGIRRSLKPTALSEQTLAYLSPRPRVSYFFESLGDQGLDR